VLLLHEVVEQGRIGAFDGAGVVTGVGFGVGAGVTGAGVSSTSQAPRRHRFEQQSPLLEQASFEQAGVGAGVGASVGAGVGKGVGFGVGAGVGTGVGKGVGFGVGAGDG
jgi:hypothetical protein